MQGELNFSTGIESVFGRPWINSSYLRSCPGWQEGSVEILACRRKVPEWQRT